MNEQEMKDYIDQLVKEKVSAKVPHICIYCDWFRFNPEHKTNRYCKYDGDIKLEDGLCKMWILAEDMHLRKRGDYTH